MHHSLRTSFFLISAMLFGAAAPAWSEETTPRLLSSIVSEDGRAIELICQRFNYAETECVSATLNFTQSGRSVGSTSEFNPSINDYSFLTKITRAVSEELGVSADFRYDNIFSTPHPRLEISNRMLNKVTSVIFRILPAESYDPKWVAPLNPDFLSGGEKNCLPMIPRRQIGRGILERESGKNISLQCLDEECKTAGMVLTSEPGACENLIGPAFHLRLDSVDALRDSLIEEISARFHFSDQLDLVKSIRKDLRLVDFKWKNFAPDFVAELIDSRAIESILKHEVRYWQWKPREVKATEFNRWLTLFSDAPYLHATYSDRCRFGTFSFSRDDQHMDKFIEEAKPGVFDGLDEFTKLKNGSWGEAEHNTFDIVIQPMFERYIAWEASAYFTHDPRLVYRKNNFSMSLQAFRITAGKSGFKLTYNAISYDSAGDVDRVASRYKAHARRDGRDLPRIISRIARHMRCD